MKRENDARPWKLLLVLSLVVTMLAACSGGSKSELPPLAEDGTGKIRVMYWGEEEFLLDYGTPFNVMYPDMEFEVVPLAELNSSIGPDDNYIEKWSEFIKEKKLDVVMVNQEEFKKIANDGLLYPLDSLIRDEQYPIDDFHPGTIDTLRQMGGNSLYGLSSHFESAALFYNEDLFKEHGVELPRPNMSVNEVLELAERFESKSNHAKDRVNGIHSEYMSPGRMLRSFASMAGLQFVDPKAEKIVMDSEAWKTLFIQYAELVKDKKTNFIAPDRQDGYANGFLEGKSAMLIADLWMMDNLRNAQLNDQSNKKKTFKWNIVSIPIDPAKPDESQMVRFGGIFAMMKDATNKREAWEFIKFSAGPEMAKVHGSFSSKLTTRTKYQKNLWGADMGAFTKLKPSLSPSLEETIGKHNISESFIEQIDQSIYEAIQSVVDGKKSSEQAYMDLLPELQKRLDEARIKEGKEKDKPKK
ncbi:ABC transporter substrate-binding protein [Paenibacillus arenosi]|uniref:Extracellular solute-binding protein n=1 Tax=Paenibacillus arenosi TaxID=2774142 RepID=A0ABR9B1L7_9BACL|nr:extracellular solute-binding protein [Paenibacillus arenosi]MBD8500234.1 extracellular solute-binding protein [Paenibacillus arenosi]